MKRFLLGAMLMLPAPAMAVTTLSIEDDRAADRLISSASDFGGVFDASAELSPGATVLSGSILAVFEDDGVDELSQFVRYGASRYTGRTAITRRRCTGIFNTNCSTSFIGWQYNYERDKYFVTEDQRDGAVLEAGAAIRSGTNFGSYFRTDTPLGTVSYDTLNSGPNRFRYRNDDYARADGYAGGFSIELFLNEDSLQDLNDDGTLNYRVWTSFGDARLVSSTLSLEVQPIPAPPAAIGLASAFGAASLLRAAAARRRRERR